MAMNKKEQQAFEDLKTELAFRWPTEPEPRPLPRPEYGQPDVIGYRFNTGSYYIAKIGMDNLYWWSVNENGVTGSKSRSDVTLYETERQAMIAMRWEICRRMARDLRMLDQRLEKLP